MAEGQTSPVPLNVLEDYAGKWVALERGKVVASAAQLGELMTYVDSAAGYTIYQVARRERPSF
jgi:Family of unknown function (DUF5678)